MGRFNSASRLKFSGGVGPRKRRKFKFFAGFDFKPYRVLNFFLLAAIIGCLGYFGYSPKFRVTNLEVRGLAFVSPNEFLDFMREEVENQKFFFIKHQNIFLTRENYLEKAIAKRYIFNSIKIKKVYPNSVVFEISEKNIQYRMRSADYEYLVDDNGQVVEKFQNFNRRPNLLQLSTAEAAVTDKSEMNTFDESDQFPLVYLDKDAGLSLGQTILSEDNLLFLSELILASKSFKFGVKLISLPEINPESLSILTNGGWEVLMNIRTNLSEQFATLNLVVEQRIGEQNMAKLERIDLRLGDNIYYKYR